MALFNALTDTTDSNATATLYALLRNLNAKVTRVTVRDELLTHPDFPSLLSLSEVLTGWKIDNTALQLNTVEQLRELPLPFVAHLRRNNGWYVLITAQQGDQITYVDSQLGRVVEPLAEFEQQWSGVVLLAETDEQSGEPDYETNRRQEILEKLREPFILSGALLLLLLVILNATPGFTVLDWLLLVTKTTGLALSGLLVAKQLGHKNALTDRFCQVNRKTNCDNVLNAPAAKLWGWLSWSDVGLVYFAGGLLAVLLMGSQPNGIDVPNSPASIRPLLHGLALLALPYTVFSVYYQAHVVRQWCTLCLLVQGILLVEGLIAISQLALLPDAGQPYVTLLTAFLLPALAWVLVKPLLNNVVQSQRENGELVRLKRNPELFKTLLMNQPRMPPVTADMHPIWLGNPNATHTITMVTNPYCGPCAKTHDELNQLIERNTNVKVDIIFWSCDGSKGKITTVASHMLAIPNQKRAMKDWYALARKDYTDWSKHYPVTDDQEYYARLVQKHCDWCQQAKITATPTLFIDGYQRPEHYSLQQISQFISHLSIIESIETSTL